MNDRANDHRHLRVEDDPLLRGEGRFVADDHPAGQLYGFFVRSPHAHARIRAIDIEAASGADGVVDVADHHVHHLGAGAADLDAAGIAAMEHLQALGLLLEEALVPDELLGRLATGRERQPLGGVGLDLREDGFHADGT